MGDYSHLFFTNSKIPPKRGELADASTYLLINRQVPLLWLALFNPNDILTIPSDDGEDCDPYLVKERKQAIVTLDSRETWLLANFENLKPHWILQFKAVLEKTEFLYVWLDTREIGSMIGTGKEWKVTLEKILEIFSNPPNWVVFNKILGDYKGIQSTEPWPYAGASGTDDPMPWESDSDWHIYADNPMRRFAAIHGYHIKYGVSMAEATVAVDEYIANTKRNT